MSYGVPCVCGHSVHSHSHGAELCESCSCAAFVRDEAVVTLRDWEARKRELEASVLEAAMEWSAARLTRGASAAERERPLLRACRALREHEEAKP